jgi:rhomboid family GlyGly-CTERM serine protease
LVTGPPFDISTSPPTSLLKKFTPMGAALIGLAVLGMVLLWLGGDSIRVPLRYDRARILEGEWWRLVTGHIVHGDLEHLLLNFCGLGLITLLFHHCYSTAQWLFIIVASVIAIDVGFLLFEPQLSWYVGSSGFLHGPLIAGAIAWWRQEPRWLTLLLTVICVGKLAWEQLEGPSPLAAGMWVIVDSHLYGAVGGALAALAILALCRYRMLTPAPL